MHSSSAVANLADPPELATCEILEVKDGSVHVYVTVPAHLAEVVKAAEDADLSLDGNCLAVRFGTAGFLCPAPLEGQMALRTRRPIAAAALDPDGDYLTGFRRDASLS